MMENILLQINELPFVEANKKLIELCQKDISFSLSDLKLILNFKDKQLVNTFFNDYKYFSKEDFLYIEKFINDNFNHSNKDFVSDLIYFALDFGLDLDYTKLLSLLLIETEDTDCLVLACIEFISMNIKFLYIEEIIEKLELIINKTIYHQNEQLLASLTLYRLTRKSTYLDFIQELINYDESNLNYLTNVLKSEMYSEKFFDYSEFYSKIKIGLVN